MNGMLLRLGLLLVAAALALPAQAAAAEGQQLYVGSGNGYSIAFKVENGKTYLLGLDATVYCLSLEPQEDSKPALTAFVAAPQPMTGDGSGLTFEESRGDQFGSRTLTVDAAPANGRLVGTFARSVSEESYHCSTNGYFGTNPEVAFEAVPYAPVAGGAAIPPFGAAASAVYYGADGPLETFFSVFGSAFGLRGTVASGCLPAKKQRAAGRGPLASSVLIGSLGEGGSFGEKLHSLGPHGASAIKEAITLAGTVDDEAIAGTYSRRIGTRLDKKRKRVCRSGLLPFRAVRYLPAPN